MSVTHIGNGEQRLRRLRPDNAAELFNFRFQFGFIAAGYMHEEYFRTVFFQPFVVCYKSSPEALTVLRKKMKL